MVGYQHPDAQWVARLQRSVDTLSTKLDMFRLMARNGIITPADAKERIDKARRDARAAAGLPPDRLPPAPADFYTGSN